jgi:predicted dithiol-disulfide oxidoreductase (DUF899 family)
MLTPTQKLARARRKLRDAEKKLAHIERTVTHWRRKVADLSFEQRCVNQAPLWSEGDTSLPVLFEEQETLTQIDDKVAS